MKVTKAPVISKVDCTGCSHYITGDTNQRSEECKTCSRFEHEFKDNYEPKFTNGEWLLSLLDLNDSAVHITSDIHNGPKTVEVSLPYTWWNQSFNKVSDSSKTNFIDSKNDNSGGLVPKPVPESTLDFEHN